jgi:hypothetical protein
MSADSQLYMRYSTNHYTPRYCTKVETFNLQGFYQCGNTSSAPPPTHLRPLCSTGENIQALSYKLGRLATYDTGTSKQFIK